MSASGGGPAGAPGRARRRAALIATAIAFPVTVILAFLFTSGVGDDSGKPKPLTAVSIAAPPTPSDATVAACTKVFEKLPVQLGQLSPRKTNSDSSFVAAWGDPAVIIRCGVARPAVFDDPTKTMLIDIFSSAHTDEVLWQPDPGKKATVYTTADREVYIEVTVPPGQDALPLLSTAVNALSPTCGGTDAAGNSTPGLPICKGA